MRQYHDLMREILDTGVDRPDRTGTGTRALFGKQMRFDLRKTFPAITTKKLAWKACVSELLWFIEGSGDERRLREILHGDSNSQKGTIWAGNAEAEYWKHKAKFEGDLGRIYGVQWRNWKTPVPINYDGPEIGHPEFTVKTVDQLAELVEGIKKDPYGRRHVLTAWNPGELDQMALPPCHMFAQFFVEPLNLSDIQRIWFDARGNIPREERTKFDIDKNGVSREGRAQNLADLAAMGLPTQKLSCQMYQRSCDMFLGVPFNIASYSLFTHMLAQVTGMTVGEFVWVGGDCHIYHNHFDQVKEQLQREPFTEPVLKLNSNVTTIDGFTMNDIELVGYQSHGPIKANMAV